MSSRTCTCTRGCTGALSLVLPVDLCCCTLCDLCALSLTSVATCLSCGSAPGSTGPGLGYRVQTVLVLGRVLCAVSLAMCHPCMSTCAPGRPALASAIG